MAYVGVSGYDLPEYGSLQFVVVFEVEPPHSAETARRRAATVLLEEVVLKYVVSFVPAEAADAAELASLAQFDRAVRTAVNLDPVQLEPIEERLVSALATVAA
jgi:hypothetical protein